ncbi:MAG: hypothetical protein ACLR6J_04145 [Parabacteroides merdae]
MVANSQVTTYMMCSGSDFFYVRSKYGHVMGDDLDGTLDCGCDTAQYNSFPKILPEPSEPGKEGDDLVAYTLKRAKEKGMEAFITYRMNDLHFNDMTTHCPIWYTDFWIQHPEYWLNDTTQVITAAGLLTCHKGSARPQIGDYFRAIGKLRRHNRRIRSRLHALYRLLQVWHRAAERTADDTVGERHPSEGG